MLICTALIVFTSSCATAPGSALSVSPAASERSLNVYLFLPFDSQATLPGQRYIQVRDEGPEMILALFMADLVGVLPVIVDRARVRDVIQESKSRQLSGLSDEQALWLGRELNADVVVTGYIAEYNASRVSISTRAIHVETGVVVWAGGATATVGWVSLNIERAARQAVSKLTRAIRRTLPQQG